MSRSDINAMLQLRTCYCLVRSLRGIEYVTVPLCPECQEGKLVSVAADEKEMRKLSSLFGDTALRNKRIFVCFYYGRSIHLYNCSARKSGLTDTR